jgi:integrase/recombinase XerD
MAGKPGFRNLHGMRGRQKGGLAAPAPPPDAPPGTLQELVPRFLQRLETRGYSAATAEMHRSALRQFLGWCAGLAYHDPALFTRARLEAYQLFLFHYRTPRGGRALAINTQLARLGCLRRFFAWLCRDGILPANPACDLDLPRKQARALPKSLSPEEINRLLALPDTASPFGLRDRTILELFYSTGVRRTEMTRLEAGDYDPDARTLLVRRGKNGKSRLLPVGGHAAYWLDRYLAEARPLIAFLPAESSLFLSGYGTAFTPAYLGTWVAKQMKRVGIAKPGASHLFRHSCATHMHENGADIRQVQEMLGHARLDTTQIYTHVSIRALQEVHARCHPHGGWPEEVPASPPADTLTDCKTSEMVTAATAPVTLESSLMAVQRRGNPDHTDDEPPAGNAPIRPQGPVSPKTPGFGKPLKTSALNKSESMQVRYYGYRFYDAVTGRWASRDPLDEQGGLNLYALVGNDGINRFDYLGMTEILVSGDGIMSKNNQDYWESSYHQRRLSHDNKLWEKLAYTRFVTDQNELLSYVNVAPPFGADGKCKIFGSIKIEYEIVMSTHPGLSYDYWSIAAHELEHVRAFVRRVYEIAKDAKMWQDEFDSAEDAIAEGRIQTEKIKERMLTANFHEVHHGEIERDSGIDPHKKYGTPEDKQGYDFDNPGKKK